jgi:Spy/CpxP family protein refolding chaperone
MSRYISRAGTVLLAVCIGLGAILTLVQPAEAQGRRHRGGPGQSPQAQCVRQAVQDLGLSQEQQDRIQALRKEQRDAVRPLRDQLRDRARALREEDPDATRRELAQDSEIETLRSEIHTLATSYREKIDAVLTEEQRTELERIREECKAQRPGAGGGMRHRGGEETE